MRSLLRIGMLMGCLAGCGDDGSVQPPLDAVQAIGDSLSDDVILADQGIGDSASSDTSPPLDGDIGDAEVSIDIGLNDVSMGPPPATLGGDRPATYYVPPSYDGVTPMPLILSLHGYSANAEGFEAYFKLREATDASGVMLVVPEGTTNPMGAHFWNASGACCNFFNSSVDDVAYLGGLIDEASMHFAIDTKRVYIVGHSNGGFMAYRMACDRSDIIAGIVSLAGLPYADADDCQNSEPVSVLHVHGVFDAVIPFDGLVSNPGLAAVEVPTVSECQTSSCGEQLSACQADLGCSAISACAEECAKKPNPNPCYQGCVASALPAAKLLWMPLLTCSVSMGCYSDWTIPWEGYAGASEAVARWAKRNACGTDTKKGPTLNLVADFEPADTETEAYIDCPAGLGAELWRIVYGSHIPVWTENWNDALVQWLLEQKKN